MKNVSKLFVTLAAWVFMSSCGDTGIEDASSDDGACCYSCL